MRILYAADYNKLSRKAANIIAGGFDGALEADGSITAELQVITGATNEMGFNKLSAR